MKRTLLLCTISLVFAQAPNANPKSDSLLAFTGARTKVVWLRMNIRNVDYSARTRAQVVADGSSVMLLDTDEGQERVLGAGVTDWFTDRTLQDNVRISRSGKWVTVTDETKTHILDLTGTTGNKRIFLDQASCSYWCVKAWGRDEAAPYAEYAYALDNYSGRGDGTTQGYAIWKIPVNADGSANRSGAKSVWSHANGIDGCISVSADQKKIGGQFPWDSDPGILDVAAGTYVLRKYSTACHTNLAADNSYRFFHLNEGHNRVQMWDQGLSTSRWQFSFSTNMVNGYTGSFWCPRWSNHTLFISTTYPEWPPDYDADVGNDQFWNWSTATAQAKPLRTFMFCVIHRLTSDYKNIEKTFAVTSNTRCWDYLPDAWVQSGYTGDVASAVSSDRRTTDAVNTEIARKGRALVLSQMPDRAVIKVTDAQGRIVARNMEPGSASVTIDRLSPGAYVISVSTERGSVAKQAVFVE